jgi:hypothetical protein
MNAPTKLARGRLAAIKGLSALKHLRHLQLPVASKEEAAALTGLQHVKQLRLVVPGGTGCTAQDFVSLAALKQLKHLQLWLPDQSPSDWEGAVLQQVLGSAVHANCAVSIAVAAEHQQAMEDNVKAALQAMYSAALVNDACMPIVEVIPLFKNPESEAVGDPVEEAADEAGDVDGGGGAAAGGGDQ